MLEIPSFKMNLFILSSEMKLTNLPPFIHLRCGRVEAVSQIAFLCTIRWWTVLKRDMELISMFHVTWFTVCLENLTHRDVLALMCYLQ